MGTMGPKVMVMKSHLGKACLYLYEGHGIISTPVQQRHTEQRLDQNLNFSLTVFLLQFLTKYDDKFEFEASSSWVRNKTYQESSVSTTPSPAAAESTEKQELSQEQSEQRSPAKARWVLRYIWMVHRLLVQISTFNLLQNIVPPL